MVGRRSTGVQYLERSVVATFHRLSRGDLCSNPHILNLCSSKSQLDSLDRAGRDQPTSIKNQHSDPESDMQCCSRSTTGVIEGARAQRPPRTGQILEPQPAGVLFHNVVDIVVRRIHDLPQRGDLAAAAVVVRSSKEARQGQRAIDRTEQDQEAEVGSGAGCPARRTWWS